MENVLFVAIALGVAAAIFIYNAEQYSRKHADKLEASKVSKRRTQIYERIYSAGIIFALAAVVVLIVGGLYHIIRDFEVVSFTTDLFTLVGLVIVIFASVTKRGTSREITFLIILGTSLLVGSVVYQIFSSLL